MNNCINTEKSMLKLMDLLTEGVHDKGIFKAVFVAGGPGSGKSYIAKQLFGIPDKLNISVSGLKMINQDKEFKFLLKKFGFEPEWLDVYPEDVFHAVTGEKSKGESGMREFTKELAKQRKPHGASGTAGLQQERNRLLYWLKKSAEAGNKRYETVYDGERFVGVLDKNSDRIYREVPYKNTEYKGKHISIENHSDYKKVYNPQWKTKGGKPGFLQLAKQFKHPAPDTVLGS